MQIREYNENDLREVLKLIRETYSQFNSKESSSKAAKEYIDKFSIKKENLNKIKKGFNKIPIFLVAIENKKIIGLINGGENRIFNLYVKDNKHREGIGSKLVKEYERISKEKGSKEIKIRSSLYATDFYQKREYKKTTGIRNKKGLKFQPMKKRL